VGSPLELSADAWARRLLAIVDEHRPERVFVDGLTEIQPFFSSPRRMPTYSAALANELRARGTTALIATEIDAYVDDQLGVPVPAASETMDNGVLLRQIELRSSLHRLVSVLKSRQMETDPTISGFVISDRGIVVDSPFVGATSGMLTGRAVPAETPEADEAP